MTIEGVAAHLAIGHDVDPGLLLEGERTVDRHILDALEGDRVELTRLVLLPCPLQLLGPQQAADDLGADSVRPHRSSG